MGNFECKKNCKWFALGIGILILIIAITVTVLLLLTLGKAGDDVAAKTKVKIEGRAGGTGRSLLGVTEDVEAYRVAALNYHNARRKEHQVGPLVLDEQLNELAHECARYYAVEIGIIDHTCKLISDDTGESLYERIGGGRDLSTMTHHACSLWYWREVGKYNFSNPEGPSSSVNSSHFTAMVWKGVKKLGIGVYNSAEEPSSIPGKDNEIRDTPSVVVALYSPRPNVKGQFEQNVFPKKAVIIE